MNYVNPLRSKSTRPQLRRATGRRPSVGAGWEIEPLRDEPSFLRSYGGRIAVSWATSAALSMIFWLPASALATACLVLLVYSLLPEQQIEEGSFVDEIEIISELDFYEELEFYEWLEQQELPV